VLQFGVQFPAALRAGGLGGSLRPWVATRVEGVRQAVRAFLPVLAGRGVVNVGGYSDYALAGLLASGALSVLGYAQVLYMLPISLFGMAVAASELPELARTRAGSGAEVEAGESPPTWGGRLGAGRHARVAYFLVPSVAVYLVLGDVVVAALYQTGAFGPSRSASPGPSSAAYALGMGASATSRFLSSAFYALGNTATPARVAVLRVTVALALGATLMFPLDRFEVGGLPLRRRGAGAGVGGGRLARVRAPPAAPSRATSGPTGRGGLSASHRGGAACRRGRLGVAPRARRGRSRSCTRSRRLAVTLGAAGPRLPGRHPGAGREARSPRAPPATGGGAGGAE
jgi:hypothetical protein